MPKITTEDCKAALEAAWPADFPPQAEVRADWKRISKTGKKGSPVERLFYHRSLPIKAVVLEENGAITGTTISGIGPWDVLDPETENDEAMAAIVNSNAGFDFIRQHDLFKPADFVFYVNHDPSLNEDGVWYMLTPLSYWKKNGCAYDEQLDFCIERHLPDDGGEVMEATFVSDTTPEETQAELLKRGFVQDPEFDAMMKGDANPN